MSTVAHFAPMDGRQLGFRRRSHWMPDKETRHGNRVACIRGTQSPIGMPVGKDHAYGVCATSTWYLRRRTQRTRRIASAQCGVRTVTTQRHRARSPQWQQRTH